jgi:hypothetical protein
MYPNINAGIGAKMAEALFSQAMSANATTGRVFIVAKAALANISEITAMYGNYYPDGTAVIYSSVKLALASCVAARGDLILVAPGHTETIADATTLALNVSGVTIAGIGTGALRPTFTFTTAITANIPVSAANVTVRNCVFVANFLDITACFTTTTAPEFKVLNCEFRDTSSVLNFLTLITTTITVNADGLTFNGNRCKIVGITAATTPITIVGTIDRLTINDNFITKAVLNNTACVLYSAALVVTNLEMARNRVFSNNTDSATGGFLIVTSSTTSSGMVYDNYVKGLDIAAAVMITGTGSKLGEFNNLYTGDVDTSGYVMPAIGSTA